jgi:hypothetical protein
MEHGVDVTKLNSTLGADKGLYLGSRRSVTKHLVLDKKLQFPLVYRAVKEKG